MTHVHKVRVTQERNCFKCTKIRIFKIAHICKHAILGALQTKIDMYVSKEMCLKLKTTY